MGALRRSRVIDTLYQFLSLAHQHSVLLAQQPQDLIIRKKAFTVFSHKIDTMQTAIYIIDPVFNDFKPGV